MELTLGADEVRVLGALVEKQLLTPDYYPLSLAGLTAACNQKTSRDPVTSLGEREVMAALDALLGEHLVRDRSPAGSRVSKYSHRLDDSLGLRFGFSRTELAVLCVLMLRGPQTPGELRTRTARMCEGETGADPLDVLAGLAARERGPYVQELAREPGRREARWAHLLGGPLADSEPARPPVDRPASATGTGSPPAGSPVPGDRLAHLEQRLEAMQGEIDALAARIDALAGDAGERAG